METTGSRMHPLDLANLRPLVDRTRGRRGVAIGLIDGPVDLEHPGLTPNCIREVQAEAAIACAGQSSAACVHGTFIAGELAAQRGTSVPAICPDCTLLLRPIFDDGSLRQTPSASAGELAAAVVECVDAGARILNLSLTLGSSTPRDERLLLQALDYAGQHGVIVVAAAGNQRTVGSSLITRHPAVIPVIACDSRGAPLEYSNLGHSIGQRGISAPGENITSLGPEGRLLVFSGTSVATPFVTGAIALLLSLFPRASAARVKLALARSHPRRRSVTPPLLDAWRTALVLARLVRGAELQIGTPAAATA